MKLNDVKCRNAVCKNPASAAPTKLSDGEGLYLWVYPDGAKRWRFSYCLHGKSKLISFGVYPSVSFKEARDKKIEARKKVERGIDLALEKKKQKLLQAASAHNTFEVVARRWHQNRLEQWRPNYARDIIKRLERDIFPSIGHYLIAEIEPPMLLQAIRKIENRDAVEVAKRQLQKCGEIFRFAIAEGIAIRDPSVDLKDALKRSKTTHYACIELSELPKFIAILERNDARLFAHTRNLIKFMMLTFVRTNELVNATWDEINIEDAEWVIPAERMKWGGNILCHSLGRLSLSYMINGSWPDIGSMCSLALCALATQ